MKKILILLTGLMIFVLNVAFGHECKEPHVHDTHNVGHQFYDALVETPKDAIVKGAVATKDLGKAAAATVIFSNAAHELKDAAKELVIETPIKTAYAIKNGTIKMYDLTKRGAKIAYNVAIQKPAHAIRETAHEIADSDFVHGTKETAVEVGQQFAEVGHDVWNLAKEGAHKVYHVAIEKPIGAVKAAGHYLAHGDEHETHEHACNTCVMVLQTPLLVTHEPSCDCVEVETLAPLSSHNLTTVTILPAYVSSNVQTFADQNVKNAHQGFCVELLVDTPADMCNINYKLSEKTLNLIDKTYDAIRADLTRSK